MANVFQRNVDNRAPKIVLKGSEMKIFGQLNLSGFGLALCLAVFSRGLGAQAESVVPLDPNLAHPAALVQVDRASYSISGLVNHRLDAAPFRHGIALFAGHPGILRLREEAGQPVFDLRGNFLVRSRRHWLDAETLIVLVDAPSDQWHGFAQEFRRTPRYGEDVAALLSALGERYGVQDWTAVGTSEGSVSAFHAARMNPGLIRRVILTASVFSSSRNGPGLSDVHWPDLSQPLLLVHHVEDPCKFTAYRSAEDVAQQTRAPLLTVRGGQGGRGKACEAYTAHGFVGVESGVVAAMKAWVKTGLVPAEVLGE